MDIVSKINEILADEFEVELDEIAPELILKDTLSLDSLDYVDLVVLIQSNFGVKLVEADFKKVSTFEDFYHLVEQKVAQNA